MWMEDLLGPSRRLPRSRRGALPHHCQGPHKTPVQAGLQPIAALLTRGFFNHPQLTSLRCRGTIFVTNAACLFAKKIGTLRIPVVANGENVCAVRLSGPNSTARRR